MPIKHVQVLEATCALCAHVWQPRGKGLPRSCPRCKSSKWNPGAEVTFSEKKQAPPEVLTYTEERPKAPPLLEVSLEDLGFVR